MLAFALDYEDALRRTDRANWMNPNAKWYYVGGWEKEIVIDKDTWDKIQMISVDSEGIIHGYFTVDVNEMLNRLHSMAVINYGSKCDIVFSKDFYQFLKYLFVDKCFHKLEWTVVIGNPIEKMYDRFCKKAGGNIIGISHDSIMLRDRKPYNLKHYEVFSKGVITYLKSKERLYSNLFHKKN